MKFRINFVLLLLLMLLNRPAAAQDHQPDINWLTIRTDHFLVHFPDDFEELGRRIAVLCEDVYNPVCESLNYYPKTTHVVLHTRTDRTNGLASPLPWGIDLLLTDPQGYTLDSRGDWLRVLITHELTHIVHLRKTRGISQITEPLFGDLNAFWQMYATPTWFIEGFPTYNETRYTSGGRGRNPFHFMEMAAPSIAGKPWKFKNTNYISRKKLPIGMYYVSGYFLIDFISRQYGTDVWTKIIDNYSENPLFGFNRAVRDVTGRNINDLYDELLVEVKNISGTDSNESGLTILNSPDLPENDYSPRWLDNERLITYHTEFEKPPFVAEYNLMGEQKKLIERRLHNDFNSFSVGKTLITWSEISRNIRFSATEYADLYVYDLTTGNTRRLTSAGRLSSPDISPDETNIAAVQNKTGYGALVNVDVQSGEITTLIDDPSLSIQNPRWSPNGKQIAFGLKDRQNNRQDIAVYDTDSGTRKFVYEPDEYQDNSPCWTPDGEKIIYTSERSGVFNLWEVDVNSGSRRQITDVKLGAFAPDVSPDGSKIAFSNYSYSGFQPAIVDIDNTVEEPLVLQKSLLYTGEEENSNTESFSAIIDDIASKPYSSIRQVLTPQGRIPAALKDENGYAVGIYGISGDALRRHNWEGFFLFSSNNLRPLVDFQYTYRRLWPRIDLRGYYLPEKVRYKEFSGWWRKTGVELTASLPLTIEDNVYVSGLRPFVGLKTKELSRSKGVLYPAPGFSTYRGFMSGLQFSRSTSSIRDIAPHFSTSFGVQFDWSNRSFSSDFTTQQLMGYANFYLPTFIEHHQLQFLSIFLDRRGRFSYEHYDAMPVGYSDDRFRKQLRIKSAYHFPVSYIEWETWLLPLYFDYLAGSFFFDWGTSWNDLSSSWSNRKKYSAGVSLTIAAVLFRALPGSAGVRLYYRSWDKKWTADINFSYTIPR